MTGKQQWMVVGAVVFAASGLIAAGTKYLGHEFVQITVGSEAPPFETVTVMDSVPVRRTLDDYRGEVTVVNVWATWCPPCRAEMPSFQKLHERYKDKGLKIVAVSIDSPGMEVEIRDFAKEFGLTFDILYDSPGLIQRDYMTVGVPETFIIGRDGVIRYKEIAGRDWDHPTIHALVDRLLAESKP